MPESPDFAQIARRLLVLDQENPIGDSLDVFEREIAEQLRLVWNARGAADLAAIEIDLPGAASRELDRVIRRLDR